MDGVTAIANILRMEGVDFIGCVPYQPLLEAAAIAGIRPIIFRQEGTGIHMVDGYSRVTNGQRIGVFMMQNGPGAENGFGGVAQAYAESVPILLLPAGMARQRRGVHPNFYPTRSYESITKWCAEINMVERVPELMRRAFAKLRSGRPGPVLLEIPQDIATSEFHAERLITRRRRVCARLVTRRPWRRRLGRCWRRSGRSSMPDKGCSMPKPPRNWCRSQSFYRRRS
jgi:acetolactate synthase-1/2/3 large subunit